VCDARVTLLPLRPSEQQQQQQQQQRRRRQQLSRWRSMHLARVLDRYASSRSASLHGAAMQCGAASPAAMAENDCLINKQSVRRAAPRRARPAAGGGRYMMYVSRTI